MIETDRLKVLGREPEWTTVTSASGAGQSIARCPTCSIAVWSVYLHGTVNIRQRIRIVRVGTLDTPDLLPPDVHIWTSEKQPWIVLSDANWNWRALDEILEHVSLDGSVNDMNKGQFHRL
jgi:hypothetical protein